jgi:tRNA(Ile)-lysidine synthase
MQLAFDQHIKSHFPFLFEQKILVAVSSGLDSMVLADLCLKSELNIALAHCNFKLREAESDKEEAFVSNYAKTHKLTFFTKHFNTTHFAETTKISIQMAARELRYNFFDELCDSQQFDTILTAHHADDNLETFFINLSRGSGVDGLTGIPKINDKIARPLLPFSRNQIYEYAKTHNIQWCEDSSNASLKYKRNALRHELIPVLKSIFPTILEALNTTQNNLTASQDLLKNHIEDIENRVIKFSSLDEIHYTIEQLKLLNPLRSYIYPLFGKYGFTDLDEIYHLVDAQSGKQIHSNTHSILKDRNVMILTPKSALKSDFFLSITDLEKEIKLSEFGVHLNFERESNLGNSSKNTLFLDHDKLQFPLVLRSWAEGDFFYPSGMTGKKKLSKYFKDEKLSLLQKSKVLLLCSKEDVVWVVGMRPDARFIATSKTKHILNVNVVHATD